MEMKAGNLPHEHSAYVRRCAIAGRGVPLPPAAPRRGFYRISWASLGHDERELWLAILAAADRAGVLGSWAGSFLAKARRSGADELSDEDAFGAETLMTYALGALGVARR